MKDANGNHLVLGLLYGSSIRASGYVEVMIGKATSFHNGVVRLEAVHRGRGSGKNDITPIKNKRTVVNVHPNSLFRVVDEVNWSNALESDEI